MSYPQSPLATKIKLCAVALVCGIFFIIARLFQLQIVLQQTLFEKSQKNFTRIETIAPLRGNILDRNNQLLATNRPTTNIVWIGSGSNRLNEDQIATISMLETILLMPLLTDEKTFDAIKYAERRHQKYTLASDITFEQLSQIAEQLSDKKNILISTHFKRYYPYQSFASHILGYLNKIDMDLLGKMGLEKMFEETLKGHKGTCVKQINSIGRNLGETETKKACSGTDIQTTLDIELQILVERVFPQDFIGTFLIMDPEDGAILALLSRPSFDPALFLNPLQEDDWQSLQDNKPFLNRAFNAVYPPGSIFKLVSVAALLETNLIQRDSCWNCHGCVEFANRLYWCNNRTGHGRLTTEESLAKSCNVLFFEMAKKISIDTLADYAFRFGLGKKTNIVFNEKEGLVPTIEWKKRVKKERWWPGETLSAAIGQSYLQVTPLQVARMISSIFTGNLVTPRILLSEPIVQEPLRIGSETRNFLQQSMLRAVRQGTGQAVKYVKDFKVYAKTSTAQTSSWEKREMGREFLEHGWFVCYLTYKDARPLTLVILVEHASSSRVPTRIAHDFLVEYKRQQDSLLTHAHE